MKKNILPLFFAISAICPSVVFGQDHEKLIKDYISQNKIREFKKSDLTHFIIDNIDASKSLQGNVVKFQQTYNGFPVYSSVGTVLIKDNKIVYYADNFIRDYTISSSSNPQINKITALKKIAENLGKEEISDFSILGFFDKSEQNVKSAKQRLVYTGDGKGNLRLAYEYTLSEPKSENSWNFLVDANTGDIISKRKVTLSCNFYNDAYSRPSEVNSAVSWPQTKEFYSKGNFNKNMVLLSPDNASYNVFALPVEAPTFGARSVVTNPWILSSSPEGWHSDGTNHYTITRGNNVYAYDDKDHNESTIGVSPDGGTSRDFNFPYDPNTPTYNNLSAATTNLFYINNKVHDIFYKFGFTETAKNFQKNNFGLGGLGNDEVMAQSQDGSGYNNANMNPFQEGTPGRMQMYLWKNSERVFWYNAPSDAISRVVTNTVNSYFGPFFSDVPLIKDVKLPSVLNGCTAMPAGELTGKIALIERGGCGPDVKIKNAQLAGADAVVIYNDAVNGSTVSSSYMFFLPGTITIPSVLITNAEGEFIKTKLAANIPVNLTLKTDTKYDGSFDNGIITHEYGHGISTRLTGDGYSCLNEGVDYEQMGEGWSDFFALMLTNKPADNASVPRTIATYARGESITGNGIRPAKYSPDFAINNFTYGSTNGMTLIPGIPNPAVHSIGFVWATMLWDLHWQYVAKYGYASDVTSNTTNGSTRVLQLVTDALKLQACNPTFVDGRNAILAADQAKTGGADKCMIWRAFAKRGLGVNASAGSKTDINDQVEDFTVPAECMLATNEVKAVKNEISIYPNPAKNEFFINFPNNMTGKASVEIYDMSGKLISSEDKISPDVKKAISTDKLINGTYMVKVKGLGYEFVSKVIVRK